jgi:hypothetical protein
MAMAMERRVMWEMKFEGEKRFDGSPNKLVKEEDSSSRAASKVFVGHTPRVLMQGRKNSRRRTPDRIPLYSY